MFNVKILSILILVLVTGLSFPQADAYIGSHTEFCESLEIFCAMFQGFTANIIGAYLSATPATLAVDVLEAYAFGVEFLTVFIVMSIIYVADQEGLFDEADKLIDEVTSPTLSLAQHEEITKVQQDYISDTYNEYKEALGEDTNLPVIDRLEIESVTKNVNDKRRVAIMFSYEVSNPHNYTDEFRIYASIQNDTKSGYYIPRLDIPSDDYDDFKLNWKQILLAKLYLRSYPMEIDEIERVRLGVPHTQEEKKQLVVCISDSLYNCKAVPIDFGKGWWD